MSFLTAGAPQGGVPQEVQREMQNFAEASRKIKRSRLASAIGDVAVETLNDEITRLNGLILEKDNASVSKDQELAQLQESLRQAVSTATEAQNKVQGNQDLVNELQAYRTAANSLLSEINSWSVPVPKFLNATRLEQVWKATNGLGGTKSAEWQNIVSLASEIAKDTTGIDENWLSIINAITMLQSQSQNQSVIANKPLFGPGATTPISQSDAAMTTQEAVKSAYLKFLVSLATNPKLADLRNQVSSAVTKCQNNMQSMDDDDSSCDEDINNVAKQVSNLVILTFANNAAPKLVPQSNMLAIQSFLVDFQAFLGSADTNEYFKTNIAEKIKQYVGQSLEEIQTLLQRRDFTSRNVIEASTPSVLQLTAPDLL
jgi:hypothetical protein